jgi:hypothetical protein
MNRIDYLVNRNLRVSKIWTRALLENNLVRADRCAVICRKLSKIIADLMVQL